MAVPAKNTPKKYEELYLDANRASVNQEKNCAASYRKKSAAQSIYMRAVEQGTSVNQLAAFADKPSESSYFAQVQAHRETTSNSFTALRGAYLQQKSKGPIIARPAPLSFVNRELKIRSF